MAVEQPAYTGAKYTDAAYRREGESLFDYMRRLAAMRSQGVLGGGGMLDAAPRKPSVVSQVMSGVPLGQLQVNVDQGEAPVYVDNRTPEEKTRDAVRNLSEMGGADTFFDVASMFIPFGGGMSAFRDSQDWAAVEKLLDDRAYTEEMKQEVKDNPYMLADLYASGGLVNNPLLDGFNVEDAGTGLFHQISTIPDRIGAALSGETYNPQQVASTKVFGAPTGLPPLFGQIAPAMPASPAIDMTPLTTKNVATYTDSGTGTDYTVQSSGSWNAADKSSWDTSGQGGKADGSYDISSWFSE